jgi:molybdopterin-containing oxidoreductase family membrane subunit
VLLWCISIVINIGMWLERYVIVVTSLHADFLPSSWGMYHGTIWDYMTFYGSIGLFLTLLFLFIRVLPVIAIFEMRELVHETHSANHGHTPPASPTLGGTHP